MLFLEMFARSATVVLALIAGALFLRDRYDSRSSKWIVLFLFSTACGALIHSASGAAPPAIIRAALLPVSFSFIVFLWIATRSYFVDDFRAGKLEAAILGLWLLLGSVDYSALAINAPIPETWAGVLRQVLSWILVGHIVIVVLGDRGLDLVESRRRSRGVFTAAIVSLYLVNKGGELFFGYAALPIWFTALLYGLIAIALLWGVFSLAALQSDETPSLEPSQPQQKETTLPFDQAQLIARLDHVMKVNRAYLEPDLCVRKLAERLDIAEHHLRAVINRTMGHRNFRGYLNEFRVKHAIDLLSGQENNDLTILDIAMQSGFGSLASFNRIFKELTKQSPSEIRRNASSSSNTHKDAPNSPPHFQK